MITATKQAPVGAPLNDDASCVDDKCDSTHAGSPAPDALGRWGAAAYCARNESRGCITDSLSLTSNSLPLLYSRCVVRVSNAMVNETFSLDSVSSAVSAASACAHASASARVSANACCARASASAHVSASACAPPLQH